MPHIPHKKVPLRILRRAAVAMDRDSSLWSSATSKSRTRIDSPFRGRDCQDYPVAYTFCKVPNQNVVRRQVPPSSRAAHPRPSH
jgi:hypothetical protein